MKKFLFLVCLFAVGAFFTACQKEETPAKEVSVNTEVNAEVKAQELYESRLQQIENGEIKSPNVETITLEALNAELVKNGLSTYTEEEINRIKADSRSTATPCDRAAMFGDINGDGSINVLDVVIGRRQIIDCGGADQSIDLFELFCVDPLFLTAIADAALIDLTGGFQFNDLDLDVIIDLILGLCP